jgi:hypothetical protein
MNGMRIPAVRNLKRKEATSINTRNWTEEEISLLKELGDLYKDYRHPKVEIAKILTIKTVAPFKYKRNRMRMEGFQKEEMMVTEGGYDPVDPGNAPNFEELELESIDEWRRCLKHETEKDHEVHQPTLPLYQELKKLWDNFKEYEIILAAKLDKFVDTSLSTALLANQKEKPPTKRKINIKIKSKRSQKRRYLYAPCQDMFRECRRKLADVVVNDDLANLAPARQPPEAEDVKTLYNEL